MKGVLKMKGLEKALKMVVEMYQQKLDYYRDDRIERDCGIDERLYHIEINLTEIEALIDNVHNGHYGVKEAVETLEELSIIIQRIEDDFSFIEEKVGA